MEWLCHPQFHLTEKMVTDENAETVHEERSRVFSATKEFNIKQHDSGPEEK